MTSGDLAARIGPNAVIQVVEALLERGEGSRIAGLFQLAGLPYGVDHLPDRMIDEAEVINLHTALYEDYGSEAAASILRRAGERTGDYLLAHRIPAPIRGLLKLLPAGLAASVLLAAMRKHAWTFAGSGDFQVRRGTPIRLEIGDCPICRGRRADHPICQYYAATFERLFRILVSSTSTVTETACQATGQAACVFEIDWKRPSERARLSGARRGWLTAHSRVEGTQRRQHRASPR